jgi:hypothetical protein
LNTKKNNAKPVLIVLLCLIIIVPVCWILINRLEGTPPNVSFEWTTAAMGKSWHLSVTLADPKSGLQRFWAAIVKDGKEYPVLTKSFPSAGILKGGSVYSETVDLNLEPQKLGLSDGKAVLRLAAWDHSLRKLGKGNQTYLEKEVEIDTVAPQIEILSHAHNINQGGSGLVVYKLSESCQKSGVLAGNNFYPGQAGYFADPAIHLAFFALSFEQGPGTKLMLSAADFAGNTSQTGFPHHINKRTFKKDVIQLSENFLRSKMPEFSNVVPNAANLSPLEIFLSVNREVRLANTQTLNSLGADSEPKMHWQGPFLRLPDSAPRAGFADQRDYRYQGKTIDHQTHYGVDLASVALSPIPAANAGKVAYIGFVGIYGNTVILDHGFGLLSLYGHMSSINVQKDQIVKKGDIIGKTGMTGLAGGDHLHFGMMVYNTFVNPIEWWDEAWIKNNVTDKLAGIATK